MQYIHNWDIKHPWGSPADAPLGPADLPETPVVAINNTKAAPKETNELNEGWELPTHPHGDTNLTTGSQGYGSQPTPRFIFKNGILIIENHIIAYITNTKVMVSSHAMHTARKISTQPQFSIEHGYLNQRATRLENATIKYFIFSSTSLVQSLPASKLLWKFEKRFPTMAPALKNDRKILGNQENSRSMINDDKGLENIKVGSSQKISWNDSVWFSRRDSDVSARVFSCEQRWSSDSSGI
ncbi:hypothetical protein F511_06969 [Dorcoceras hygrometricum]|uniref:Uncharacterized protein n=1 Tax=Dorcoceras hygrometricum TaxID=472368 RepID=A0A2Z7BFF2_9LAMI|nr:hypothetical protein F511_06969 [Dorcoceras hygrometricum]